MIHKCEYHSCIPADLFDMMDTSQLSFKETTTRKYSAKNKLVMCAMIFTYCWRLIILDIINEGITFSLPTNKRHAYIQMTTITGERFKEMYREGSFEGLDFLVTNFTACVIKYRWLSKDGYKEKPIYLDKQLKEHLYTLLNSGKTYY